MKTIAFSDLHGNYNLWNKIKNYYNKDDILIYLGDACDRGPDGIKIMQEMFQDDRIIYLKGNHEDMFLDFINNGVMYSLREEGIMIDYNGCRKTLEDYIKLSAEDKISLVENLKKIKNYYIYINNEKKNIFLSHAGIDIDNINNLDENSLLWDRKHIKLDSSFNNQYENWYVIHGHTPVQSIKINDNLEVLKYYNGHKIDIDLGSAFSNKAATINLDTFEIKYFKGEDDIND